MKVYPRKGRWWLEWYSNGKRRRRSLKIPVTGRPPEPADEFGDIRYETSKAMAHAKAEQWHKMAVEDGNEEWLLRRLIALKTGTSKETISLLIMADRYLAIRRKRPLNERYALQVRRIAERFRKFLSAQPHAPKTMAEVTEDMASRFVAIEDQRGLSGKTKNEITGTLRSIFSRLGKRAGVIKNPFENIEDVDEEAVPHRPLTDEQVRLLLAAAKTCPFAGPLIVVGVNTALRLVDACTLRRKHVHLNEGLIAVKTAKGGQRVWIPISDPLREVLEHASKTAGSKPDDFMFPEQAAMFATNPDGISLRIRKVFVRAGFTEDDPMDTGSSLSENRSKGVRRVNLRGFHALRTSWVTFALMAGVPIELVRKVTGHSSVNTVLAHYFQPEAGDLAKILKAKMPSFDDPRLSSKPTSSREKGSK